MGQYVARNTANKGEGSGKQKNIVNVVLGGSCSPPPSPNSCQEIMSIQTFPEQVISFSSKDFEGVTRGHNQALVVTLDIAEKKDPGGQRLLDQHFVQTYHGSDAARERPDE